MKQKQRTIARDISIAAALFAVVLALAANSQAMNSQTGDSIASASQTNGQNDKQGDLPASTQDEATDNSARPGAIARPQMLDAGNTPGYSKPAPPAESTNSASKPAHSKKHKHNDDSDSDEFRCTPDTPTTSAACGYR